MTVPAFRDFDPARFLRENWQKRPLLIRDPWQAWTNPLEPDELAGLACEPEVESRLIGNIAPDRWELEQGPLPPARFGELGRHPWTLLVQSVDHHVPAVAALLEPFRFIPNWRVDDIMVSYAVDGGGVGAHFDHYDVFLVQGLGRRRWRIGQRCDDATPLLPHDSLRLLADFEPTDEWVLEPGDILYVPPGFAHEGVAIGNDCMTYSIGFRAPSRDELVSAWTEHVLETLSDGDRYADADLSLQDNPGEIRSDALDRLQHMITETLADRDEFARWFGAYATAPKIDRLDWAPDIQCSAEAVRELLISEALLERNPASRFAFVRDPSGPVMLFVDGQSHVCSGKAGEFAEQLSAESRLTVDRRLAADPLVVELVRVLVNSGSVAFTDSE